MYLVGHAIVAFLIAYTISGKVKVGGGISFALVMLVACLPDIDILFQSAGITSHKTYTHSFILSMMIVPAVIFMIARWRKVSYAAAFIYSIVYIQHVAIGDIVIGGTNILYPIGELMVGTGIGYGTVAHQALEFLLLAAAASIIIAKSFGMQSRDSALFRWNITDRVSYALLIGSLVISFAYLLYGVKVLPRLFIETDLELALFVLLHLSAIAVISFLALVAKHRDVLRPVAKTDRS